MMRPTLDGEAAKLLGALAAAAVGTFLLSLAVGPTGFGILLSGDAGTLPPNRIYTIRLDANF